MKPTTTLFQIPVNNLNEHNVSRLEPDLLRLAAAMDADELHLDLVQVQTASSAGLALLIALRRQLVHAKKHLVLCNVADEVSELLRLTRLDTLLDVRAA
jgi:anti-anti-sigma factor